MCPINQATGVVVEEFSMLNQSSNHTAGNFLSLQNRLEEATMFHRHDDEKSNKPRYYKNDEHDALNYKRDRENERELRNYRYNI